MTNGEAINKICEEINKEHKTNYKVIPSSDTLMKLIHDEKTIMFGTFAQIAGYLIKFGGENVSKL